MRLLLKSMANVVEASSWAQRGSLESIDGGKARVPSLGESLGYFDLVNL
jgi:hypothetical protein